MTTIYSGLFTHEYGFFPTDWTPKAISRQTEYCKHLGFEYKLLKSIPWGLKYPLRHAWSFGTLIKFVALDLFLQSDEECFTWIDLDVYPTDEAFNYELPFCNLFYAPFVNWGFSDTPGHEHMKCKREWCNFKSDYYAVNSGMFQMDRITVKNLWNFINQDANIKDDEWWERYYNRQVSFSKEHPWLYGSDEAIMEEWFNKEVKRSFDFKHLTEDIHSVHKEHNPLFMHYYGPNKKDYGN